MHRALIAIGSFAVLGVLGIGSALAEPPREVPPTSSGALQNRCASSNGNFETHADGTYLCHFPNGTTISCDPDRCIQYLVGPRSPRGPQVFNNGSMSVAQ